MSRMARILPVLVHLYLVNYFELKFSLLHMHKYSGGWWRWRWSLFECGGDGKIGCFWRWVRSFWRWCTFALWRGGGGGGGGGSGRGIFVRFGWNWLVWSAIRHDVIGISVFDECEIGKIHTCNNSVSNADGGWWIMVMIMVRWWWWYGLLTSVKIKLFNPTTTRKKEALEKILLLKNTGQSPK